MRRIGVYVSETDLTVAVVEGRDTVWGATAPLQGDERSIDPTSIASDLGLLLARIPRLRWPRARVNVTLGAPWARVKRVRGVPPVARNAELVAMLRLSTHRFIAASRPVLITGAVVTALGEASVGVVDRAVSDAITHEILERDLRMGRVSPAVVLDSQDRSAAQCGGNNNPHEPTGAAVIATAAARGAMLLALGPRDNLAAAIPDVSRKRVVCAAFAFLSAALICVGAQFRAERVDLTRSVAAVHAIAAASDSGAQEEQAATQLNRDLATAVSFSRHRVSTALLLGAITQALPAEAAITTLHIDTATVDIVALSPRTAAVVDALSDVPNLAMPTVVGPVSRETVGARELERATIRLRIAPDYGHAMVRFAVDRGGRQMNWPAMPNFGKTEAAL